MGLAPLKLIEAYKNGTLSSEKRAAFKGFVDSGEITLPEGVTLESSAPSQSVAAPITEEPKTGKPAPRKLVEAYQKGTLSLEKKEAFEGFLKSGEMFIPEDIKQQNQNDDVFGLFDPLKPNPSNQENFRADLSRMFEAGKEMITGEKRMTPEVKAAKPLNMLPELQEMSAKNFALGLATISTDPEETARAFLATHPTLRTHKDSKGNIIYTSTLREGETFANEPGASGWDAPRVALKALQFYPASRRATAAGRVAAGIGTETAHQGLEATMGGDFNKEPILLEGAMGAGFEAAGQAAKQMSGVSKLDSMGDRTSKTALDSMELPKNEVMGAPPIRKRPDKPINKWKVEKDGDLMDITSDELLALMRKAIGGDTTATAQLSSVAKMNEGARDLFEGIGFDFTPEVISDNKRFKNVIADSRKDKLSPGAEKFEEMIESNRARATEMLKDMGAAFEQGRVSPAASSEKVRLVMDETEAAYKKEAGPLFNEVEEAIGHVEASKDITNDAGEVVGTELSQSPKVQFKNLERVVNDYLRPLQKSNRPKEFEDLAAIASSPESTYADLKAVKEELFNSKERKTGMYADRGKKVLDRFYDAVREDQEENVFRLGGQENLNKLRSANAATVKYKEFQDKIIGLFGKKGIDGIGDKLRRVMTNTAKGGVKAYNQIIGVVPEDLKPEVLLTALADSSFRDANGSKIFSFADFSKSWEGLKANKEIFKEFSKSVGRKKVATLEKMSQASRKLSIAQGAGPKGTGADLSPLVREIRDGVKAENLVDRFMLSLPLSDNPIAKGAYNFIRKTETPDEKARAMSDFLAGKELTKFVGSMNAKRKLTDKDLKRLTRSGEFNRFWKGIGMDPSHIKKKEEYIKQIVREASRAETGPEEEEN
jgi:hypothetical protein